MSEKGIACFHLIRYFSNAMKMTERELLRQALASLESFAQSVPGVETRRLEREVPFSSGAERADIVADLDITGQPLTLAIEVKASGQPRIVREAAHQLKRLLRGVDKAMLPMIIAPYLSPVAQDACREEGVAWLDFEGNAHLAQGSVLIDRQVATRPRAETRALLSIFKPKAARLLRVMLKEPGRSWRTIELGHHAQISLGQVSNVAKSLRERGWAETGAEGLRLIDPAGVLDAWAQDYKPPRGEERRLYTTLHGKLLTDRLRGLALEEGRVALASYSAADWLAPYGRHPTSYFYADEGGAAALERLLSASDPGRGANLSIVIPDDDGVLVDAESVAEDLVATSPVQTYLDLFVAGERGREAADHLREKCLEWAA